MKKQLHASFENGNASKQKEIKKWTVKQSTTKK